MKMSPMWKINAEIVSVIYDGYVDWDEGFYICPDCGEPVYDEDWDSAELKKYICPICEFDENVKEG